VWWTFKVFSHEKVSIIDGGYDSWRAAGGDVELGAVSTPAIGSYTASYNPNLVLNSEQVLNIVETGANILSSYHQINS